MGWNSRTLRGWSLWSSFLVPLSWAGIHVLSWGGSSFLVPLYGPEFMYSHGVESMKQLSCATSWAGIHVLSRGGAYEAVFLCHFHGLESIYSHGGGVYGKSFLVPHPWTGFHVLSWGWSLWSSFLVSLAWAGFHVLSWDMELLKQHSCALRGLETIYSHGIWNLWSSFLVLLPWAGIHLLSWDLESEADCLLDSFLKLKSPSICLPWPNLIYFSKSSPQPRTQKEMLLNYREMQQNYLIYD